MSYNSYWKIKLSEMYGSFESAKDKLAMMPISEIASALGLCRTHAVKVLTYHKIPWLKTGTAKNGIGKGSRQKKLLSAAAKDRQLATDLANYFYRRSIDQSCKVADGLSDRVSAATGWSKCYSIKAISRNKDHHYRNTYEMLCKLIGDS